MLLGWCMRIAATRAPGRSHERLSLIYSMLVLKLYDNFCYAITVQYIYGIFISYPARRKDTRGVAQ